MNARVYQTVVFLSGLAFSTNGQAQQLASPVDRYVNPQTGMSLEDAISYAIEHQPELRAVRADSDAAHGARLQATLRPNPNLSVERREQTGGIDNQTSLQVEWPLDMFRRSSRIAVADRELEAAERVVDDRVRLLAGDVRSKYGRAASAARDVRIAEALAASTRRGFELLRQRVDEGASPPLDRDVMDVERQRIESDRFLALGRADAAMIELKHSMGMQPGERLQLHDALESLAPPPLADQPTDGQSGHLDVTAPRQRSDILEAEAQVAVAASKATEARNEGRVDINLFGSYMRMNQSFSQLAFNEAGGLEPVHGIFHYAAAGATIMLPLRNRNQGQIASADAQRRAAQARLESVQLAAAAELAEADAIAIQVRRALHFSESAVRLARRSLEVVQQTYELGRATVSDVVIQQGRYLDTERAYTQTLLQAFDAQAALLVARGER